MSQRKTLDNFRTMKAPQVTDTIRRLWQVFKRTGQRHVLYIEGPPGGGKTSIVKSVASDIAQREGLELVDTPTPTEGQFGFRCIHLGNIGEEVMAGLPWVDKAERQLHRAMDVMWPTRGQGILLLDEPFQAGYAQRFVSQLTSEGRFGDYYHLPAWLLVLCGNSSSDRAGTQRIWTHVQNRIIHVRLEPQVNEVLRHFRHPAQPELAVYLNWFPERLHQFTTKGAPFTSPRTLDYANSLLAEGFDPVEDFAVFQGLWGTETALDFKVTFDAVKDLPDIESMLANPSEWSETMRAMGANNPASVCALASVVLKRLDSERDIEAAARGLMLMEMSSAEHAAAFLAVAETIDARHSDGKTVLDTPAYTRFMAKHSYLTAN